MSQPEPKPEPKPKPKRSPKSAPIKRGAPPKNWRAVFLRCLEQTANVSASARVACVDRKTAYNHREADPEFAEAWDEALEASTDLLEAEARRRALAQSDTLLIFLLKGARPERYRDNFNLSNLIDQLSAARTPGPTAGPGFGQP